MMPKRKTRMAIFIVSFLWIMVIPLPHIKGSTANLSPKESELLEQGKQLFSQGKFKDALSIWQEAPKPDPGQLPNKERTLLALLKGEAYRKLGQYQPASSFFNQALQWGKQGGDSMVVSQAFNHLGAMAYEVGENEKAMELLLEGLQVAKTAGHSNIVAGLLNSLGNVFTTMDRNNEALGAYTESAGLAGSTNNQELELIALINSARAAKQAGLTENSEDRLDLAMEKANAFPDAHSKVNNLLTVGLLYAELHAPGEVLTNGLSPGSNPQQRNARGKKRGVEIEPGLGPPELKEIIVVPEPDMTIPPFPRTELLQVPRSEQLPGKSWQLKAYQAFQDARRIAYRIVDLRGESYANGHLGHLYEGNEQYEEALSLTRQAVLIGQKTMAPDLLYQWHWQIARIHKNQGQGDEAKQAYRQAIAALGSIRNEVSVAYQSRKQPFREGIGSMYFELANLLLLQTKDALNADQRASLLVDARNTIEAFKAAELQDYFQEECVQPSQSLSQTLQQASPNTAVIYPILLQDRTEIIVNFPSGLKQYTIPVPEKELTQQARQFRTFLQQPGNLEHQKSSKKLYAWLIQPLEQDLQAEGIQTLVMVPDGALRSIPLSALHDGTGFLIEKYAIATTPGLTLTDPKPLARDSIKVLSLGITQAVQGFPALPYVEKELETIAGIYGGMQLLNENFVVQKMENQLKNEDYNIVHIASHGLVESNVKNTFVLAFDQKITMDRLAELVGLFRFRKAPLELLTLSACETAAGDDRAALGLAGVAVKAGARSALATLWFIDDAVTSDLIGEFYKQLQNPTLSKAQALQKAQVKILKDPRYQHPNFWAPFLLINNWL